MKQIHIEVPKQKDLQRIKEEQIRVNIRKRREVECFPYINRGRLWYSKLSDKQLLELSRWYQEWLDAPVTKTIPKKPVWLDKKLNNEDIL